MHELGLSLCSSLCLPCQGEKPNPQTPHHHPPPLTTQHSQAAATYRKTIMFAVLTTVLGQKTTFKQNHVTHGSSVEVFEKVKPDKNYSALLHAAQGWFDGVEGGKARLTHPVFQNYSYYIRGTFYSVQGNLIHKFLLT